MPKITDRFGTSFDIGEYFDALWKLISPYNEKKYDHFYADKTHVRSLEEWADIFAKSRDLPSRTRETASLWDDYLLFIKTIWPIKGTFCDELAIALSDFLVELAAHQEQHLQDAAKQRFKQYLLSLPQADVDFTFASSGGSAAESPLLLSLLVDCWSKPDVASQTFENLLLWIAKKAPRLLPKGLIFDSIYQKHKIGPYISDILLEGYLNDLPCPIGSSEEILKQALLQELADGLALSSQEAITALQNLYACRSARIKDTDADYFAQTTPENQAWFHVLQLLSHRLTIQNPYAWLVPGLKYHEIPGEGLYWEFPPSRFIVSGDGERLLYLPYVSKAILAKAGEAQQIPAKAFQCFDGENSRAFEMKERDRLDRSGYWLSQAIHVFEVSPLLEKTVKQIKMLLEGIFYAVGLFVDRSYSEEQNIAAITSFTHFVLYLEDLKNTNESEYQRLMRYPVTIHNQHETFAGWLSKVQNPTGNDNCIAVFSNTLLEIVLDYYPQAKFTSPEIAAFSHLESRRKQSACYAFRDFIEDAAVDYEHSIIRLAVSLFTKSFTSSYYGFGKTTICLGSLTNDVTESGSQLWRFLERYLEPEFSKRPHFTAFIWANCVDIIKEALANPPNGRAQSTTLWLESLLKINDVSEHRATKVYDCNTLLAALLDHSDFLRNKYDAFTSLQRLVAEAQKTLEQPEQNESLKQKLEIHVLWYKTMKDSGKHTELQSALQKHIAHPQNAKKIIADAKINRVSAKKSATSSLTDSMVSAAISMFSWTKKTQSTSHNSGPEPKSTRPKYVTQNF